MTEQDRLILSQEQANRIVSRLATQILEKNVNAAEVVLIGMRTGGIFLARLIQEKLKQLEGVAIPIGVLDITLYRDDISTTDQHHFVRKTEIPFSLNGRVVLLVDDVLHTGRSTRAALDAMMDFGRPKRVQLAVLVDRGERELPISPNFVGKTISIDENERVEVIFDDEGTLLGAVVRQHEQTPS
ncbi:MAG: bifunctional pyr operon transcriptional regulator/uracil phosphoribosyltransferase PyrR [Deltaproteobacteria bacterium]|nr:bifunctional pyr operon transcriptional regulator/uracil phosphoribosyltransferase PyrR [Candidatus Zymogenaceae bacterium]